MKVGLVAVALIATWGVAHGQSGVTIYGLLDAAPTYARTGSGTTLPGGTVSTGHSVALKRLDTGVGAGSRLGFRGREDLGDGLFALFILEHGPAVDTGGTSQGGAFWGRQSLVGIGSTSGWSVTMGRQYTPLDTSFGEVLATYGVNWGNASGSSGHGSQTAPGSGATVGSGLNGALARINNSIQVKGTAGPFTGKLLVAAGDENDRGTGHLINPDVAFVYGNWTANASLIRFRASANELTATAASPWLTEAVVGGSYNFGFAKLYVAGYEFKAIKNKSLLSPAAAAVWLWDKTRTYAVGTKIPIGVSSLVLEVSEQRYSYATLPDGKSTTLGVNYYYPLSKRTTLYGGYGKIFNNAYARSNLIAVVAAVSANGYGADPSVFSLGLQHSF